MPPSRIPDCFVDPVTRLTEAEIALLVVFFHIIFLDALVPGALTGGDNDDFEAFLTMMREKFGMLLPSRSLAVCEDDRLWYLVPWCEKIGVTCIGFTQFELIRAKYTNATTIVSVIAQVQNHAIADWLNHMSREYGTVMVQGRVENGIAPFNRTYKNRAGESVDLFAFAPNVLDVPSLAAERSGPGELFESMSGFRVAAMKAVLLAAPENPYAKNLYVVGPARSLYAVLRTLCPLLGIECPGPDLAGRPAAIKEVIAIARANELIDQPRPRVDRLPRDVPAADRVAVTRAHAIDVYVHSLLAAASIEPTADVVEFYSNCIHLIVWSGARSGLKISVYGKFVAVCSDEWFEIHYENDSDPADVLPPMSVVTNINNATIPPVAEDETIIVYDTLVVMMQMWRVQYGAYKQVYDAFVTGVGRPPYGDERNNIIACLSPVRKLNWKKTTAVIVAREIDLALTGYRARQAGATRACTTGPEMLNPVIANTGAAAGGAADAEASL